MRNDKANIIVPKSFAFALNIISFCENLERCNKYIIARQLLRSGTSIGANVREAQNAESKVDFIQKIKIAAKEADETEYWLLLCKNSMSYSFDETLPSDVNEIIRILTKIISSSKKLQNLKMS